MKYAIKKLMLGAIIALSASSMVAGEESGKGDSYDYRPFNPFALHMGLLSQFAWQSTCYLGSAAAEVGSTIHRITISMDEGWFGQGWRNAYGQGLDDDGFEEEYNS